MTIEYVTATYNPFTGCKHTQAECPTADKCWARAMSKRFSQVCGGDFEPRFHPGRLNMPLHWRKPQRVATCFMGDLFGGWNNVELPHAYIIYILAIAVQCHEHQFLFLTKQPENLAQFNPWPKNAWVGISLTGVETPERQAKMLEALHRVEGVGVRWLSYEPVLGPLAQPIPKWLDWVVLGAQSGRGAKAFELSWTGQVWRWATDSFSPPSGSRRPLWEKNNLARYLWRPLMQEIP